MPTKVILPSCDDLFAKFFDRWYTDDDRKRKAFPASRPDVEEAPQLVGKMEADASRWKEDLQKRIRRQIEIMTKASHADWPTFLKVSGQTDLAWIEAFNEYHTPERVQGIIRGADPSDYGNGYVVRCCELGAVIGHVMGKMQPRFLWLTELPYWESALFDPRTGAVLPVFHWAIRKLSGTGINGSLVTKMRLSIKALDARVRNQVKFDGMGANI